MHWLTIYKKSNIPAEGWIQQCFMCYRPTSYTVDYKKNEHTHTVYLCKCCQNKNKNITITTPDNIYTLIFKKFTATTYNTGKVET